VIICDLLEGASEDVLHCQGYGAIDREALHCIDYCADLGIVGDRLQEGLWDCIQFDRAALY